MNIKAYRLLFENESYTLFTEENISTQAFSFVIPVTPKTDKCISIFGTFFAGADNSNSAEVRYCYSALRPGKWKSLTDFLSKHTQVAPTDAQPKRKGQYIQWYDPDELEKDMYNSGEQHNGATKDETGSVYGDWSQEDDDVGGGFTPKSTFSKKRLIAAIIITFLALMLLAVGTISAAAFMGDGNVLGVLQHQMKLSSQALTTPVASIVLGAITGGAGMIGLVLGAIAFGLWLFVKKTNSTTPSSPAINKAMAAIFGIIAILAVAPLVLSVGTMVAILNGTANGFTDFLQNSVHLFENSSAVMSLNGAMITGSILAATAALILCGVIATIVFAKRAETAAAITRHKTIDDFDYDTKVVFSDGDDSDSECCGCLAGLGDRFGTLVDNITYKFSDIFSGPAVYARYEYSSDEGQEQGNTTDHNPTTTPTTSYGQQ